MDFRDFLFGLFSIGFVSFLVTLTILEIAKRAEAKGYVTESLCVVKEINQINEYGKLGLRRDMESCDDYISRMDKFNRNEDLKELQKLRDGLKED